MQTLVIQTQHRENYAAHNEGYKHGVDQAHWKFKGGNTYFVTDLTSKQINKIANGGIPTLTKLIESKNEMFEEYILDWEIRDLGKNGDGKGPICEPLMSEIAFEECMAKEEMLEFPGLVKELLPNEPPTGNA